MDIANSKVIQFVSIALSLLLLIPVATKAESIGGQPFGGQTLGPIEPPILAGDSGTYVKILMPQGQNYVAYPVKLAFYVTAALIPYCSFGNVGYSLDNGPIYSVTNYENKTIMHEAESDNDTVWVEVILPSLAEGSHSIEVYYGYQFNSGYDVVAYSAENFSVSYESPTQTPSPPLTENPSPTHSIPEFPTLAIVPLLLCVFSVAVIVRHRKIR